MMDEHRTTFVQRFRARIVALPITAILKCQTRSCSFGWWNPRGVFLSNNADIRKKSVLACYHIFLLSVTAVVMICNETEQSQIFQFGYHDGLGLISFDKFSTSYYN